MNSYYLGVLVQKGWAFNSSQLILLTGSFSNNFVIKSLYSFEKSVTFKKSYSMIIVIKSFSELVQKGGLPVANSYNKHPIDQKSE